MTELELRDCQALDRVLIEKISRHEPSGIGFNIRMNIAESVGQTVWHAHRKTRRPSYPYQNWFGSKRAEQPLGHVAAMTIVPFLDIPHLGLTQ